jgi:sec-independent protein translocase protein TatA
MLVIGVIALLVFGPKKLPEIGAGLGKAIKDFKSAMNDTTATIREQIEQSTTETKSSAPAAENHAVEEPHSESSKTV